ncbi:MFS transporter [Pseudoroseomonas globiformis]|uniref:MFS transporter n=1 Tax=Teichococcus globiformis TaxID=2307229 RepID=A0ABV7G2T0_9PROT
MAYSVAAPALLPALLPREGLAAGNRVLELARSAAFAAGPALGGALLGWAGAAVAYALATALAVLAAMLLARLPEPASGPAGSSRGAPLRALGEAAGFVLGHPLLRPILLTAVAFNLAWFLLMAVFVAWALQGIGMTPAAVGLVLGLYGGGMVAGAMAAGPLGRLLPCGTLIALGPASAVLASWLLLLAMAVPGANAPALAGTAFLLFGVGPVLWTIGTTTLRQAVTPLPMLGRVSALVLTATFGARPVGAALGAALAAWSDVEAVLWASAACFAVQALVIALSPVPRLRRLPDALPTKEAKKAAPEGAASS